MIISDSTVAAVSTPRAAGGISVIRISGDNAFAIADRIFTPLSSKKKPSEMEGYTCAYGKIHTSDGDESWTTELSQFSERQGHTQAKMWLKYHATAAFSSPKRC